MWAVEGFRKEGVDTALEDGIRDAGFRFLDASGGALDGITAHCSLGGPDRSRIFAFDGLHAAILVIEDRKFTFCQQVSSGTYDLGYMLYLASLSSDLHGRFYSPGVLQPFLLFFAGSHTLAISSTFFYKMHISPRYPGFSPNQDLHGETL